MGERRRVAALLVVLGAIACGGGDGGGTRPEAGDGDGPKEDGAPSTDPSPFCAAAEGLSGPLAEEDTCTEDRGVVLGAPLVAPDSLDAPKFFPFGEAKCRDGSTAGISVRVNPASTKLLLYLQGGGVCLDPTTCAEAVNGAGLPDLENNLVAMVLAWASALPLIDREDPANPLRDWSQVFVHYCSGDVHSGTRVDGDGDLTFVGHANLRAFLGRIVPTFPDLDLVLLAGSSAGSLGAILNYETVQRAFGCTPVHALFDSAYPWPEPLMDACMGAAFDARFDTNDRIDAVCEGCGFGEEPAAYLRFLAERHPGRRFGIFSPTEDCVVRGLLGRGIAGCRTGTTPLDAAAHAEALAQLRDGTLAGLPNAKTFFHPSNWHTLAGMPAEAPMATRRLGEIAAGETDLGAWIAALVSADAPFHHVCSDAPAEPLLEGCGD